MSGECNSSPLQGCTDSQTVISLDKFTEDLELKLGELIVKKGQIVTDLENCSANNNALLETIIDQIDTLKTNGEECCEALQDALDDIIDILPGGGGTTPTTTEEPVTPTTTEEPVTPTTTEEPVTPTTTEEPQYLHGLFNYDDDPDLLCLEDNTVTLYYEGIVQVGTTLYTDQGLTPFTGGDYIKRNLSVVKYSINGFGTITALLAAQCE